MFLMIAQSNLPKSNLQSVPTEPTLLLLTVVLLRVLRFLPTIPLLGSGMPPMIGKGKQQ